MKIIVTTTAPDIESVVDTRFGRGAYFLVVNPDTLEWQAAPNPAVTLSGGAGIRAAQFVADQKPDAVISGDFGPHAHEALKAAGVPMYLLGSSRTARDAIARFADGQLQQVGAPTREDCHHDEGHHDDGQ